MSNVVICRHIDVYETADHRYGGVFDDRPTHWRCRDCGSMFPLIGDTDQWEPEIIKIGRFDVPVSDRKLWANMGQNEQHPADVIRASSGLARLRCTACGLDFVGTIAEAIRQWNLHLSRPAC